MAPNTRSFETNLTPSMQTIDQSEPASQTSIVERLAGLLERTFPYPDYHQSGSTHLIGHASIQKASTHNQHDAR